MQCKNYLFQLTRAIVSILFLAACSRGPSSPMAISLAVSPEPIIGSDVDLQIELISSQDAPNTVLTIMLPFGIELVEGELIQHIALKANEPAHVNSKIRVTAVGQWQIYAH